MTRSPSPQQLRYLTSLDELRHFGRAANACAVSQSTLSAGILALEETLATSVLDRSAGRRVAFTAVGTEIVRRARAALAALDAVADAAADARAPMSGPLRLGVIPTIGPFLLPALIPALAEAFPLLRPLIREQTSERLIERLVAGTLDLALVALPYDVGDLELLHIGRDQLAVALPRGHRLLALPAVPVASLANERMLLLADEHCLRDQALQVCGRNGEAASDDAFAATSLHTLTQMVAAGLGVALLPQLALDGGLASGLGVETRPVAAEGAWRTLGLAWRRGNARERDFRALGLLLERLLARDRRGAASRGSEPRTTPLDPAEGVLPPNPLRRAGDG